MIRRFIEELTESLSAPASTNAAVADRESSLRMATAVLMVEVARADQTFDESEFDLILTLARDHFELPAGDIAELVTAASDKAEDSVSAYEFTKTLHQHLDEDEKARIVSLLWQIAYADGRLDKYENSYVLKISDLLHVNRGRVMRLKHDAAENNRNLNNA